MTPAEAVAIVQSRLEAVHEVSDEVWHALGVLSRFVEEPRVDDGALYWGGSSESYTLPSGLFVDKSCTGEGNPDEDGRHYGLPHCIYCLQGE